MKKVLYLAGCLTLLAACTPSVPQAEYDQLKAENDSIKTANEQIEMVVKSVSNAMDQIAADENMIFVDDQGRDVTDKKVILGRLEAFRQRMLMQHQEADSLKQLLKNSGANTDNLVKLIDNLKAQIVQKDNQLAELQAQLEEKNASIADLKNQLQMMSLSKLQAEESRDYFLDIARAQDEVINTGYYIVDTKKGLKEKGLTEGVFKKRANYAKFDPSLFTAIDVRDMTVFEIQSKSPKLITEKPANSYTIVKNADGTTTLTVTDVALFWEGSPFLIIQL
ncbi:MAG: hypothetical protein J6032_04195 [Bacteroidales bacterium]|nr:hypothetical protein [Bacteroidales bacterium]